jgi:2-keto-4-pentenoate hydratase/2-oxohepta-3-ene-1,7-dioic acid hydratase in catechol pathway
MKLYTFVRNGVQRLGAAYGDGQMVDLLAASQGDPRLASMMSLIEAGDGGLDAARTLVADPAPDTLIAVKGLTLAAPIPRPPKMRGFSVFEQHIRQSAHGAAQRLAIGDAPSSEHPMSASLSRDDIPSPGWYLMPGYYLMDAGTVTGHDCEISWPHYSDWVDYELEIVAVIGTSGRDILVDDASKHIFGYTLVNDLSARDAQLKAMGTGLGVGKGKDFDQSNPMGPCIVTADEIADPYALNARVLINGVEWSSSNGRNARYHFNECIAYASASQMIHAGELFASGTLPNSSSLELQRDVKRGDTIDFEVERIGNLRARIAR